ncbi:hypothetical protein C0V75_01175 [Tabrizicola sp. TH137]|uniref:sulfotransferase family 2 domain-containing protein n=1 Tax=Tabrizicola sp. TH137 TaxID=2067452 RepID=UPI000C7DAD31|nr:sulfotransferase family 2 domain-containing protein [Tabrizicola sp. TH137]PLL14090.1 hypothetical protein C0V75_01175 [Tabrizicola sp. TH137]
MSDLDDVTREARALAGEFGTTVETMAAFLRRFAPRHTQADQFRAASDVMLFVHIPKTAGMSLGASLSRAFGKFRAVQWSDIPGSFRFHMRHALYLQTRQEVRQVMIGHFGWPELQQWRSHDLPLKCGTLLRDPLARMVSNYNYNRSEAHPDHATFRDRFPDMMSYARHLPMDVQMTQAIGMVDSFDTALRKFILHYSFLGVTEHLAASLDHLARTHGLPRMKEQRVNVGKIRPEAELPPGVAELVAEKSHNDAKLHRLLMRLHAGG